MRDQTIRRGAGGFVSSDSKETLRKNWETAVRITRPLVTSTKSEGNGKGSGNGNGNGQKK